MLPAAGRAANNLITRLAVQQYRQPDAGWTHATSSDKIAQLRFAYRVVCDKNLYGPKCAVSCSARDDQFGHYTCNPLNGSVVCLEGWTGQFCAEGRLPEVFCTNFVGVVFTTCGIMQNLDEGSGRLCI